MNPIDTKIRAGKAAHAKQSLPAVLGLDMAGIVEKVGPEVTGFKAGDEVYASAMQYALARHRYQQARCSGRERIAQFEFRPSVGHCHRSAGLHVRECECLQQKRPEVGHEVAGDPVVRVIKQNSHGTPQTLACHAESVTTIAEGPGSQMFLSH